MNSLKTEEERIICKAVLRNDEEEITRILATVGNTPTGGQVSRRGEESKSTSVS